VNAVLFAERSKVARHEAAHVAAAWLLGEVLGDVEILPPPRDGGGYCQGSCAAASDPRIRALVYAVGQLDGHGSQADEFALTDLVPDPDARAEVLASRRG
jgi:hypothetical protein